MTDKINRAILFALKAHSGQSRKDGKPYIAHPFSVATELAKNGADDDLICAGLLHDTIEDGGVDASELENKFGKEVLRLVLFDTENKELPWKERKSTALCALEACDRRCAMLICADKLSNLKDISDGLECSGEAVWEKFKYGRDGQEWLYGEYVKALAQLSDLKMYCELKQTANTVFSKGDGDYAGKN